MKYVVLTFLSIFILACSSDSDSNQDIEEDQLFIKQINEDGLPLVKYTFTNNLIASKAFYDSGQLYRTDDYQYSNDIVIVNTFNASDELTNVRRFYALSNDVSRRDSYNENDELLNYRVYNFSANSCGFISIEFFNNSDELNSRNTFEYTDENCSMASNRFNSDNDILAKEEWIRDDKNFYNKKGLLDFFRPDNLGNTLIYNKWDANNIVDEQFSYESSFIYNDLNYPISEQRNYLNGSSKVFTYEYYE